MAFDAPRNDLAAPRLPVVPLMRPNADTGAISEYWPLYSGLWAIELGLKLLQMYDLKLSPKVSYMYLHSLQDVQRSTDLE
jgi:hypothetical protein